MKRLARFLSISLVLALLAAAGATYWWLERPLPLRAATAELSIEPGETPRDIARGWVSAGVSTSPWLLYQWFRLSGDAKRIRAGSYEIETGITARGLLRKMVLGDESLATVRLIEGWTFRQMRAELARTATLRQDSAAMSDEQLMQAIGAGGQSPEGRFFPDTYAYSKGSSDLQVYRRSLRAMQHRLDEAWASRGADSPLASPEQVLTLASIVEKETGRSADRAMIAGVFVNRLRAGMPLQTDPTVIYGLGDKFDGNLRKRDLQTDTPYNTYLRPGLPPTPIALPGRESLQAAANPARTKALYFVAKGDGSSHFSQSLNEHNRAVDKYQRGQAQ